MRESLEAVASAVKSEAVFGAIAAPPAYLPPLGTTAADRRPATAE